MIQEAIQHVQEQAETYLKPQIVKLPGDPDHVHYLSVRGELTPLVNTPHNRTVSLERLDDLIRMATTPFDVRIDRRKSAVFYNEKRVELVFNTDDGRERAFVNLVPTAEFNFFTARVSTPPIAVEELRSALRFILANTGRHGLLIEQVSTVVFQAGDTASVNLDRGRESMGSTIQRETSADKGMPDEHQVFDVRRWLNADLSFRFPIACLLDPDNRNRRWILLPVETSMMDFKQSCLEVVRDRLREGLEESGVPVFQGWFRQKGGDVPGAE